MGQKVHPTGVRVGIIKDWNSKWYANSNDFADYLVEDQKIRKFLKKKLYNLKVLDLSHNKITSMNGIENLYKLKVLYLMNNKIYKLCNLNDLLQLEYLILDKNKISDISKIPVKIKYIDLGIQEIDLKDYKNTENKYSLNTSFIKLRGGEDLDIDYILENGKYDNHTKTIIWENLSTDKLQFEFNNIEDDWMNFSGIVNICLVDKI